MNKNLMQPLLLACGLSLSLSACQTFPWKNGEIREQPVAGATIEPRSASFIRGVVTFREGPGGLFARATLSGITPGTHAIHLHANPNCDGLDANGAGPVHIPDKAPMGSIVLTLNADIYGEVTLEAPITWLPLSGDNGLLGRSLVVHTSLDPKSRRVACGVILPL